MEAVCSSETSVEFLQATRRYIPEDRTLQVKVCLIYYELGVLLVISPENAWVVSSVRMYSTSGVDKYVYADVVGIIRIARRFISVKIAK
jgi:hypothetical protein